MREYSETVRSWICGSYHGGGAAFEARSPLTDTVIARGELLGDLSLLDGHALPVDLDIALLGRLLSEGIESRRTEFVRAAHLETGFNLPDCEELIEGALAYAQAFATHRATQIAPRNEGFVSNARRLALVEVPYGTVAVILPNNAFLPLALACLLSALRAGNRVILRAPTQSAHSASLIAEILHTAPEAAPYVSVAICSAPDFVDWFMGSPGAGLLHFFGSSRRAAELVARGFDAGKTVLIDGEGNVWAYVDRSVDAGRIADLLVDGAFRYNGQTCTSINGSIVHPDIFNQVSTRIVAQAGSLREGQIGPVFNERQAAWCLDRVDQSGGEVLVGGKSDGAHVAPTVVVNPDPSSDLVREGVFGPVLWLAKGDEAEFTSRWPQNRYPLCAAIFQESAIPAEWTSRLAGVARLVLNGDPSIEDPFEYWGGYPPAGQNAVSAWPAKYRRTVQIDLPE
jgi:acyl-CoA reductase-like NAD-dependent aldehyde dehydrogenase